MGRRAVPIALLLALALTARAADFYVDAQRSDVDGCGHTAATACQSWTYWYLHGCDGSGCADNVAAGDTIHVAPGSYGTRLTFPFKGTAEEPVTVRCDGAPGACRVDGAAITSHPENCGLVCVGCTRPSTSLCNNASAAQFLRVQGFRISSWPKADIAAYGFHVSSPDAHHVVFDGCSADGAGMAHDPTFLAVVTGPRFITWKNGGLVDCGAPDGFGCTLIGGSGGGTQGHLALVGSTFGPLEGFPSVATNSDALTIQNQTRVLIDGNTVTGASDLIDMGMSGATPAQSSYIVRYNRIVGGGVGGGHNAMLVSSCDAPSGTNCGDHALYKNVMQPDGAGRMGRCVELTERTVDTDVWNNTCFATGNTNGAAGWIISGLGDASFAVAFNDHWRQNIFDGTSTAAKERLAFCETDATTVDACGSAACTFRTNGVYFPERGAGADCLKWSHGRGGSLVAKHYTCGQIGSTLNADEPSRAGGNFRADPHWAGPDRSNATMSQLASLALSAASVGYRNTGDTFCHATSAGTGSNTITVICDGASRKPAHWFPQPSDYYQVANGDCAGKGTRAHEANGGKLGCFDLQIEGCAGTGGFGDLPGVRTVSAIDRSAITFSGAPCSWARGARVGVPWSGSAPDLGALELAEDATR